MRVPVQGHILARRWQTLPRGIRTVIPTHTHTHTHTLAREIVRVCVYPPVGEMRVCQGKMGGKMKRGGAAQRARQQRVMEARQRVANEFPQISPPAFSAPLGPSGQHPPPREHLVPMPCARAGAGCKQCGHGRRWGHGAGCWPPASRSMLQHALHALPASGGRCAGLRVVI